MIDAVNNEATATSEFDSRCYDLPGRRIGSGGRRSSAVGPIRAKMPSAGEDR